MFQSPFSKVDIFVLLLNVKEETLYFVLVGLETLDHISLVDVRRRSMSRHLLHITYSITGN